jgi:hypothetical protein
MRPFNQQSSVGRSSWQRASSGPRHGSSPGFRANASPIITLDRELLTEEVGKLSKRHLELIFTGIDIVLGR